MESNTISTPNASQGVYQPIGVPAEIPTHSGMTQGVVGIICGVIALLFFPPIFGLAGIILGVLAIKKGERTLGITAIVISAIFTIIGMIFGMYVFTHPEMFDEESLSGAVINATLD